MNRRQRRPRCIVIAGPNGSGKTTFAREYLPKIAGIIPFVNADLIAQGLSPLDPGAAAVTAGRVLLREVNRLAAARADFAFETTLSGLSYARQLKAWKADGYVIDIAYLRLKSPRLALRRIAARVRQGGHNVPRADVLRRYVRGWDNFQRIYRALPDEWAVYDSSNASPTLIGRCPPRKTQSFADGVGRGLRLAARSARKTARLHRTPIYVWEDGSVVAKKP